MTTDAEVNEMLDTPSPDQYRKLIQDLHKDVNKLQLEVMQKHALLSIANRKRRAQRIALRQLNKAHATLWKVVRIQAGDKSAAKEPAP